MSIYRNKTQVVVPRIGTAINSTDSLKANGGMHAINKIKGIHVVTPNIKKKTLTAYCSTESALR